MVDNYQKKRKYILRKREDELIDLLGKDQDSDKIVSAAVALKKAKARYFESKIELYDFESTKNWMHDKKKLKHLETQISQLKKKLVAWEDTSIEKIIDDYKRLKV